MEYIKTRDGELSAPGNIQGQADDSLSQTIDPKGKVLQETAAASDREVEEKLQETVSQEEKVAPGSGSRAALPRSYLYDVQHHAGSHSPKACQKEGKQHLQPDGKGGLLERGGWCGATVCADVVTFIALAPVLQQGILLPNPLGVGARLNHHHLYPSPIRPQEL